MIEIPDQTREILQKQGLELKVEPSFKYGFDESTEDEEGNLRICRINERRPQNGLDVSLYKDGKLCLSPCDKYYSLQENESKVRRDINTETTRLIMLPFVKQLVRSINRRLIRVYEIPDVNLIQEIELGQRDYTKITRKSEGNFKVDYLFIFDNSIVDESIIDHAWIRRYPDGKMCDKLLGNSFSIYFFDQKKQGYSMPFESSLAKKFTPSAINDSIVEASECTIMSLSYGFRIRILGFQGGSSTGPLDL